MSQQLKSSVELKKISENFFNLANQAAVRSPISSSFFHDGFRVVNGVTFKIDSKILEVQNKLIHKCISILGPKLGHEREVEDIAWAVVSKELKNQSRMWDLNFVVKDFIDLLSSQIKTKFEFVAPNHAFIFVTDIDRISIGPVEAIKTEVLLNEVSGKWTNLNLKLSTSPEINFRLKNNKFNIEIPRIVWRVSAQAARGHLEEESIWLINIAISFFRLFCCDDGHRNGYGFPDIGERDPLPTTLIPITKQGISFTGESFYGGETSVPVLYSIDADVLNCINSERNKKLIQNIFFPEKSSLGGRIAQGLGWMSRGRQALDRAEKFLYFFTAIEALLSSSDKSVPIVQTIARYIAVILIDDVNSRPGLSDKIKGLYELRSSLVHSGRRNVSISDVFYVQFIVENIYLSVMDRADILLPYEKFHKSLERASFGLIWTKDLIN